MITSLHIQNFRGLKDVSLNDLKRVNLIVGGNDTGKTSVLEALVLLLGDKQLIGSLSTAFRANQSGNGSDDKENFWSWLFHDREFSNEVRLTARSQNHEDISIVSNVIRRVSGGKIFNSLTLIRNGAITGNEHVVIFDESSVVIGAGASTDLGVSVLSTRPANPVDDAERFNQVALESDGEAKIETIMRQIEPRVRRLRYAKLPGTSAPLVFVDLGFSRSVPATQMGQAFNRVLHIYSEILASKTKVLLIDEIENGIFWEALPQIWKGLSAICEEQNVQIFATTHSRECVMAAFDSAKERDKDELSVQRMQFVKGQLEAVAIDAGQLEVAERMGLEVRS